MSLSDMGKLICKARKIRKISQGDLACHLGMSRSTISGIENGRMPEIGVRKLFSICTALGLELQIKEKTARPTLQELLKEQDDD